MAKNVKEVDAFIHHRPGRVVAQLLQGEDVAAVGATVKDALEGLQRLVAAIERRDPGVIPEASADWSLRTFKLDVPSALDGSLFSTRVHLLAVIYAGMEEGGVDVFVPQVSLHYRSKDHKDLEALCAEYVRDQYPLDGRITELIPWLEPWSLDPEHPIWLDVRRLSVSYRPEGDSEDAQDALELPVLTSVGEPLHLRYRNKDAPRAFGRKALVDLLVDYLVQPFGRSVLLTGPAGVGKSTIVAELVGRTQRKDAPELIRYVSVWQISGGRIMAGMRFLGQWQERVLALIEEAKVHGVILFAENLVELLETSGTEQYAQGIPGLLLPHILSGDIVLITEARPEQLAYASQRHPSFVRALRKLPVEPMDAERTDEVLERVSFRLGRQYGVRLLEETRQKILELTSRFRGNSTFPGPAVELAERTAMTFHREGSLQDGEEHPVLKPDHVVEAYASQTGMPRVLLDPDSAFDVDDVRRFFEAEIFDQTESVDAMVDLVTVIRAGLYSPRRPMGSFLFLGPTGVGKTQTVLTLAKYLFGSSDRMLRFDMSEYQDAWSAGRLVGRYKGEQGELVRRIREQPFRVVLLDEIEKADNAVFDILLQALGEGRLTDALGQTVHLTSTVFVMTSNLGAGGPPSLGFGGGEEDPDIRHSREAAHYRKAVEEFFRPEFVGRIDRIISFRALTNKTARKLVEYALRQAFRREGLLRRNVRVRATDRVVDYLIQVGFDERYGARPLRQAVERYITAPLAAFIASASDVGDFELVFELGACGAPELEMM